MSIRRTLLVHSGVAGAVAASLLVVGCVDPSSTIGTKLSRYGLDAGQAQCVGDRLETNLSIAQLRQLGRAAEAFKDRDSNPGRLTLSDLTRVAAQINDPKVAIEVVRAAAGCGVATAAFR